MMFLRMYMMLTFFTVAFLYINLKILKKELKLDHKNQIFLIVIPILGFLTQYFFAIYAAFVFIIMMIFFLKKKQYKEMIKYIRSLVIAAVLGVLIFPFSIGHMLWSERGVGSFEANNIYTRILDYLKLILINFGSKWIIMISLFAIAIWANVVRRKQERKEMALIVFPTLLFIVAVSILTEFIELRYVMNILPIVSIMIITAVGSIFESPKYDYIIAVCALVLLIGYGFITERPLYLYKGYNRYVEISEEYKDDDFVYVGYTFFNHMKSMPEFMNYRKSYMIYSDQLERLTWTDELNDKTEFILSVDQSMEPQEIAKQVVEVTGFRGYELVFEGTDDVEQVIYRVYR